MNERAGGLRTPIAVMRNMDRAHRVSLDPMSFGGREGSCLRTHDQNLCSLQGIEKFPSGPLAVRAMTADRRTAFHAATSARAPRACARASRETFRAIVR